MPSIASYALTSVADVKANLDITSTAWDTTVFPLLINAATDWIEKYCGGRRFINPGTDQTEYYESPFAPGDPVDRTTKWISLKSWPIVSVTSVSFRTGTSSYAVQDTTNYDTYSAEGQIYFRVGVPRGPQSVKVIYQGGYTAGQQPSDLQYACIKLVSKQFARRKAEGKTEERSGGNLVSWQADLDEELKNILSAYQRSPL